MIYRIAQWDERYEVDEDNRARAADSPKAKRREPLAYIRSACHGHSQGFGYRQTYPHTSTCDECNLIL